MTSLPLADVTVVEIATFVAGPSAGLALAQLGADVIRVDPLGGAADHHRWPLADTGGSYYWSSLNRSKRSVEIDLRSDAGRDLVRRMACASGPGRGIVVDNLPRADWLSWPELTALRPDVIHVHIEGHRDGRPAVDYTVNAEVGIPLVTGPPEAIDPVNHVLPAWDLLCGMSVTTALLAALHQRTATGRGGRIDIALADIALAGVANLGWFSEAAHGVDRPRTANAIYGSYGDSFTTGDGRPVMVVALTPSQWRTLVAATGTAAAIEALEVANGVDLSRDEAARYNLRHEIAEIFGPWFAARGADEVAEVLDGAAALWAPYRTLRQAADAGEGPLAEIDQPGLGPVVTSESPLRWRDLPLVNRAAAGLGADTVDVLKGLVGLDSDQIAALADNGVVRPR